MSKRQLIENGADLHSVQGEENTKAGEGVDADDHASSAVMVEPDAPSPYGQVSEAELQAHLAELEAEAIAEDLVASPVDYISPRAEFELRLREARDELDNLRGRLAVIKERAATVVSERAKWADASARDQLGPYPWAKLAGAMAGTFLVSRVLRTLPFGAVASAAMPMVIWAIQAKGEGNRRR
ncbi:hypothetical protein [Rhizobium sp. Root1220]|uniref:hypothetical protein n=1 Tax=Rhizobium sp. Root1220 TaxID=1736432 RepID=UPI0006FF96B6|nr:hypothetical protein [Rhizobium sp. Root1220]KQV65155.1 hypothetical protein ASC90_14760 [Rhizobium sp. Root1220]